MEQLRYPVGKFKYDSETNETSTWISTIRNFPSHVENIVAKMSEDQLNSRYRPDGWTARQVVHHVADSHSHAMMRFKTSLTEDRPTIKPYLESEYALLPDYNLPLDSALSILAGVHSKWTCLLENMKDIDYQKGYFHPESGRFFSLHNALSLYDWHCRHHLGHLEICKDHK